MGRHETGNQIIGLAEKRRAISLLLATAVGAAAFSSAARPAQAGSGLSKGRQAVPIERVSDTSDLSLTDDLPAAEAADAKLAAEDFNEVIIPVPYTQTGAEINNDVYRICVSAKAAKDNGLYPVYVTWGYDQNGNLGFIPRGTTAINKYAETANKYPWYLSGPNGCASIIPGFTPLKAFGFGIFNEVNSPTYDNTPTPAPDPANYVQVLTKTTPLLKATAAQLGINLTIYAANQAYSHDPIGYIEGMADAVKKFDPSGAKLFDIWGLHPYEANSSVAPATGVSVNMLPQIRQALKEAFGYSPPIGYTEFGVESLIPMLKRSLYKNITGPAIQAVPAPTQAQYYGQYLDMAACQGVVEAGIFQEDDDGNSWQSGLWYADGTPKSSAAIVKGYIESVRGQASPQTCP